MLLPEVLNAKQGSSMYHFSNLWYDRGLNHYRKLLKGIFYHWARDGVAIWLALGLLCGFIRVGLKLIQGEVKIRYMLLWVFIIYITLHS